MMHGQSSIGLALLALVAFAGSGFAHEGPAAGQDAGTRASRVPAIQHESGRRDGAQVRSVGERRAEARIERRSVRRIEFRRERRHERREFARGLGFTDAQREFSRQLARDVGPRARELRAEGRAVLERVRERVRAGDREGARQEAREALHDLRRRAMDEFAPRGRALVDALTPEQRAKIEARVAERGRTFDPEKASQRLGRALAWGAARVHGRDADPSTRSR